MPDPGLLRGRAVLLLQPPADVPEVAAQGGRASPNIRLHQIRHGSDPRCTTGTRLHPASSLRSHKAHVTAAMPSSTEREEEVGQGHCPSVHPGARAATPRPAGSPARQLPACRPAGHARRGRGGGGCGAERGGGVAPQRDLVAVAVAVVVWSPSPSPAPGAGGWVGGCVRSRRCSARAPRPRRLRTSTPSSVPSPGLHQHLPPLQ